MERYLVVSGIVGHAFHRRYDSSYDVILSRYRPRTTVTTLNIGGKLVAAILDYNTITQSQECKSAYHCIRSSGLPCVCRSFSLSPLFWHFRSMFVSSIRSLAFLCLVGLAMVFQADAACGGPNQAQFNADSSLQQGVDGELYCAVRCFLHGKYCDKNVNRVARGSDSTNLTLYYGSNISNWCVGLVKDFSYAFAYEVSNSWKYLIRSLHLILSYYYIWRLFFGTTH
jgi:hypothetical protein